MRDLLKTIVLGCLLASCASACGSDESPQPQPPQSRPPAVTLTLGWDQQAPDADELAEYSYVLYVDGVAVVLTNATCGALAGEGPSAACSSPLPALQPGQHVLELVTRVTWDGVVRESARSAPLVVTVAGSASSGFASLTAPPPSGPRRTEMRGPDGTPYVIEMVASGLDRPTALARLPDGRLLIAERRGRVRIADAGVLLDAPALELTDADTEGDEGWSLAVAPDFAATRHVYVSYVARDAGGARIGRVVRFREAGGTLGEAAVILDGLPAQAGVLRTRIGPDGALYVGTTALEPRDADDLGSYAGKVLRFTADGVTPPDNPFRASPVFSFGHRGRLDFDWEPAGRGPLARRNGPGWRFIGTPGLRAAGRARGLPRGDSGRGRRVPRRRHTRRMAQQPVSRVARPAVPLPGDRPFLVAARADGRAAARERFGRIVAVLSSDDGLYFATGNGGVDDHGRPADAVFRIREKAEAPGKK